MERSLVVEENMDNVWSDEWAHEGKQSMREEQPVEDEQQKAKVHAVVEKEVAEETDHEEYGMKGT